MRRELQAKAKQEGVVLKIRETEDREKVQKEIKRLLGRKWAKEIVRKKKVKQQKVERERESMRKDILQGRFTQTSLPTATKDNPAPITTRKRHNPSKEAKPTPRIFFRFWNIKSYGRNGEFFRSGSFEDTPRKPRRPLFLSLVC